MNQVRWGIIGCGNVTELKSGPAFQKIPNSSLLAVMRRDLSKAEDYARRHNVPHWYNDADALINNPDVNAIYVATPPDTHELYALKACAANKPCYVEKPMSRNTAEAQRMLTAFQQKKLSLFIAYYRRALPRFRKAKELLDSNSLGDLHTITYRYSDSQMLTRHSPVPWRLQAQHAGGGLFLDLASHALDLLDFFFGPLTQVQGRARNWSKKYEVEDNVTLTAVAHPTPLDPAQLEKVAHLQIPQHEREALASLHSTSTPIGIDAFWNFSADRNEDYYEFAGEDATLRFSCFGNEPLQLTPTDDAPGTPHGNAVADSHITYDTPTTFDLPNPQHIQQPLIQTIVDSLLQNKPLCPSTATTALRTQQVMDLALDSYYGGREDNFWTRDWPK